MKIMLAYFIILLASIFGGKTGQVTSVTEMNAKDAAAVKGGSQPCQT